jgi:hypothetical protein
VGGEEIPQTEALECAVYTTVVGDQSQRNARKSGALAKLE